MLSSYVVLDFETANNYRTSICQIGMVKVIDNVVVDTVDQFIFPYPTNFSSMNIQVHGIHFNDVKFAPKFNDFYPEFKAFVGELPIICHNASFDMSCLNKTLTHYKIDHHFEFMCTLVLCRRLLSFESNKLSHLATNVLNFKYQAHDALSDCLATEELIKYLKINYDIENTLKEYKVGTINKLGYNGFKKGK